MRTEQGIFNSVAVAYYRLVGKTIIHVGEATLLTIAALGLYEAVKRTASVFRNAPADEHVFPTFDGETLRVFL